MKQIQDYLQTQAIELDWERVAIARVATQAVIANGQAHIDPQILLHADLPAPFSADINKLKQLFMALDASYSRHEIQTAVLYAWQPENQQLIRLVQQGEPIENTILVNEDSAWHYLAARTANSGWANIAEDVAKWLQIGELQGEHNRRAISQTSLPICGEDGVVYGVLQVESRAVLAENALAEWVGLALGVLPVLREWCPREGGESECV